MVDGEGNDGGKGVVFSHKSDIGTVQGGDDGDPSSLRFHYFLGHISGRGMGDGIVYMEEVQLMVHDHIHHGAGQGCLIGGVVEEGVIGDPDLVIEDIGVEFV